MSRTHHIPFFLSLSFCHLKVSAHSPTSELAILPLASTTLQFHTAANIIRTESVKEEKNKTKKQPNQILSSKKPKKTIVAKEKPSTDVLAIPHLPE